MHFISPSAASALFLALVDVLTLFSCMCMMASDTLTEMESVASSILNGPSNFSETWYRASERWISRRRHQGDKVVYDYIHSRSYRLCWPTEEPDKHWINGSPCLAIKRYDGHSWMRWVRIWRNDGGWMDTGFDALYVDSDHVQREWKENIRVWWKGTWENGWIAKGQRSMNH